MLSTRLMIALSVFYAAIVLASLWDRQWPLALYFMGAILITVAVLWMSDETQQAECEVKSEQYLSLEATERQMQPKKQVQLPEKEQCICCEKEFPIVDMSECVDCGGSVCLRCSSLDNHGLTICRECRPPDEEE